MYIPPSISIALFFISSPHTDELYISLSLQVMQKSITEEDRAFGTFGMEAEEYRLGEKEDQELSSATEPERIWLILDQEE